VPTYGWIREDSLEAFYEGTERFRELAPPKTPTFRCPFCTATYTVRRELQNHVSSEHTVERPLLLLGGVEPSRRTTIRVGLSDTDVFVENTSTASVAINGGSSKGISLKKLTGELTASSSGELKVSLTNDAQENATPVVSSYELSFRVESEDQLRTVERTFDEIVLAGYISREVIGRFLENNRNEGMASEYAVGLAE
jgi:hypothetical protein